MTRITERFSVSFYSEQGLVDRPWYDRLDSLFPVARLVERRSVYSRITEHVSRNRRDHRHRRDRGDASSQMAGTQEPWFCSSGMARARTKWIGGGVRVELVRMTIDECVTQILGDAGFADPHQRRFQKTRNALEISLTDLARSPRNKTGHLHLARVKGRRIVLQKEHWDAVGASVSLLRSRRETQFPASSLHENSLVVTIARTCRTINTLEEYQLRLLTAVMRIVEARLRMKAEVSGASVEEIATYLSTKGLDASHDLESSLDDLTPAILQGSGRHPGQRRFTAAC